MGQGKIFFCLYTNMYILKNILFICGGWVKGKGQADSKAEHDDWWGAQSHDPAILTLAEKELDA